MLYKAKSIFCTTDKFYPFELFYNYFEKLPLKNKIETIELMCHPGHPSYKKESELVENIAINSKLKYQLISYNDL
jgi:hypothetical protein